MLNFVAIDIETTGFSLETCEIIELGGLKYKNGQPIDTFSMYVKPQKYVPLQISKITGITMETLSMADGPEVCIPKFVEFCEDLPLLGHNLKFDYDFIKKYSSQYDFDFTLGNSRQGIDTLELCRKYLTLKSNTLEHVCKFLQLNDESGTFHSAYYDALMTSKIYVYLSTNYPNVKLISTPHNLEDVKVKGKAQQMGSLPLF